jgi:small subunit ribosomal protein S1
MTGIIRGKEMYNESDEFANLKTGDEAEATVLDTENEQGMLELSFRYAGHQRAWAALGGYKTENKTVSAKILDANKGGLLISVNSVAGFLPVSQLSPEYYPRIQGGDKNKILEKLKAYVGSEFKVKILDAEAESEKLIVSEKSAWEEDQKEVLNKYKEGDLVEGKITAVTDFGVFVEFGESLEGLIHISELAWQRIDDPRELFDVGDEIKAEIIKVDGSKIFLSSKRLKEDPWKNITDRYKVGETVEGTVIKSTPFGLFVELDKDIHGLAHISELSDKTIVNLEEFCKPGEKKAFKIVSIEPNEHRLGLSLKSMKEDGSKQANKETSKQDDKETVEKEIPREARDDTDQDSATEETPKEEATEKE